MNNKNIKIWEDNDCYYAEWSDRSIDDDERYRDDSILIKEKVKILDYENEKLAKRKLKAKLVIKYDEWIRTTRS